jgi:hypothetical protein
MARPQWGGRAIHPLDQSITGAVAMFYVHCPLCLAKIEIHANAVGVDRTDPWNVICCDDCDTTFDYDDEDVRDDEQQDDC